MPDYDASRLTVVDHPLVQHKLHILRDKNTPTTLFRELTKEISLFLAYEATRDLPLEDIEVETPLETITAKRISNKKLAVIPILRAGLGMTTGVLELIPGARVGMIGMRRNEETFEPVAYYSNIPDDFSERTCLVVDPMLATGGSLKACIKRLRSGGTKDIRVLTIVSAPDGVKAVLDYDPDVRLYTCTVDRELNENAYILPGLGDAGDRLFGTM